MVKNGTDAFPVTVFKLYVIAGSSGLVLHNIDIVVLIQLVFSLDHDLSIHLDIACYDIGILLKL